MSKEIIIKKKNGKYKIPLFIKLLAVKYKFKVINNQEGNDYDKQVSLLVEALNIKDRKQRIKFIYEKSCELLDNTFYGKNICEFKNNRCMHDRIHAISCDGCCKSNDGKLKCKYLINHKCSVKCLACKFHICYCVRNKGYKFKINDILMIKYLYNWKQKLFIYNDFFMSEDEVLEDLYKNSILLWLIKPSIKWVKNKNVKD